MVKLIFFCSLFSSLISFSQIDSSFILKIKSLDTANVIKIDTASVPNDMLTKKIKLLRSEKKGVSTEAIIKMKLLEEQQKDTSQNKNRYNYLLKEFTQGRTSQLLQNCLINLYRKTFTESEIDELIRFYKTSAGKKMDMEYLLLMVRSVKDAEQLMKIAIQKLP